jgi:hypothetical protein
MNLIIEHTESTMIDSSNYNPETNELIVTFKGGSAYSFKDVVTEDYKAMVEGESVGKAFNQYIRKYNGLKLESNNETNIEQING